MNLLQKNSGVEITWLSTSANEPTSYYIERSTDGINFTRIGNRNSSLTSSAFYTYFDNDLPPANNVYYRLS